MKFVFETLLFESPQNFWNWFTHCHNTHSYATSSASVVECSDYFDTGTVVSTYTLRVQKSKLVKFGGRLIKVMGPLIWNRLPNDIQDATSVSSFKDKVKSFYISQYES